MNLIYSRLLDLIKTVNHKLFFSLIGFSICRTALADSFSDTSLDKQMGSDIVEGQFVSTDGSEGVIENMSSTAIKVIVIICVFLGFLLCAKAIYDFYVISRDGRVRAGGYNGPTITLIVGCALAILPTMVFLSSNSIFNLIQ